MKMATTGAICLAIGLGVGTLFTGSPATAPASPAVRGADRGAAMSRLEMAAIVREDRAA